MRVATLTKAAREQYAIIAIYVVSDTDNVASRLGARDAAHKINGALGTFGRHEASKVAAAIEALLAPDSLDGSGPDLVGLLAQLDALIG